MRPNPIQTERLLLRPPEFPDAPDIERYVSDFDVAINTLRIPHPYPPGAAVAWLERHLSGEDKEILFAITTTETQKSLVGVIGVIPEEFDRGEIGYWIGKPYWGRGFATEAARAVIDYCFAKLPFNRIEATVFTRNPASMRVLEKCGLRREGTLRQRYKRFDEYVDGEMYAILRGDWSHRGTE